LNCSGGRFDLEHELKERTALEARMGAPDFWNNRELADKTVAALKRVKARTEPFAKLDAGIADLEAMLELGREANDEATLLESAQKLEQLKAVYKGLELQSLFSEASDAYDAYLSVQAGAGGTDACDWAGMVV